MATWSRLLGSARQIFLQQKIQPLNQLSQNGAIVRFMSEHRVFRVKPSRWHWDKTKDLFHFYFCLGAIPVGISIFLINIFIGKATLTPIPEGYEPQEYEYHRHPISRFFVRYIHTSSQQEYEKFMHYIYHEHEMTKLRELEAKIRNLIRERKDYQAYYFLPYTTGKYVRKEAQMNKDAVDLYSSS